MTKTKYKVKNAANAASYYTSKFAFTPVVAAIDTVVVAGSATLTTAQILAKTVGTSVLEILKAPVTGVIRANEIHKERFQYKYENARDKNRKLATGELVEIVVPTDATK
jgi:hypothetical protein